MISLKNICSHLLRYFVYKRKFAKFGKGSILRKPLEIRNPFNISIGEKTFIGEYAWFLTPHNNRQVILTIGNNVQIGHYSHIVAMHKVYIGDSVLIADKVFISDCTHPYKNIEKPILEQPIERTQEVSIGCDSWIGENACVLGVNIGKHCVIGANSVVTKDIPDYCVAVGMPAKIIKRYDKNSNRWVNV